MTENPNEHKQSRLVTDNEGEFDQHKSKEDALPVEDGEIVNTDELDEHQEYIEGRGIYDERNKINDLTGKEWKFATKSVIPKQYPPDMQHELRSEHGGQKPPRLCLDIIERFSKSGDTILDPFAGVGGSLLGASLAEYESSGLRHAIGFELNPKWIEVYEEVMRKENSERSSRGEPTLSEQDIRQGNCEELINELDSNSIDFLLTDVPYWNMDKMEQTRNENKIRGSKLSEFDEEEIEGKSEWLDGLENKFGRFYSVLKEEKYMAVFIGDMYREHSYNMLSYELADRIKQVGYTLKANLVWYDPSKDLHVYGYPFSFVPSMVHQNILIFKK